MTKPVAEGGCLCGAIRYRIMASPQKRSICHCRSCRRGAGAPTVAWLVMNTSDVVFHKGAPTSYESSPGIHRTFCNRCGTSLTWHENDTDTTDVTTATLDDPNAFPPLVEIWTEHKINWESLNGKIPTYPGSSRGED